MKRARKNVLMSQHKFKMPRRLSPKAGKGRRKVCQNLFLLIWGRGNFTHDGGSTCETGTYTKWWTNCGRSGGERFNVHRPEQAFWCSGFNDAMETEEDFKRPNWSNHSNDEKFFHPTLGLIETNSALAELFSLSSEIINFCLDICPRAWKISLPPHQQPSNNPPTTSRETFLMTANNLTSLTPRNCCSFLLIAHIVFARLILYSSTICFRVSRLLLCQPSRSFPSSCPCGTTSLFLSRQAGHK